MRVAAIMSWCKIGGLVSGLVMNGGLPRSSHAGGRGVVYLLMLVGWRRGGSYQGARWVGRLQRAV